MKIGLALSSEDHGPRELVELAKRGEAAGFHGLWISDHYHPWIGERFALGVGSGEALNEHILGDVWPEDDERLEILEESIEVMRLLWEGGVQSHRGRHYRVSHARVYDLPDRASAGPDLGLRPERDEARGAHRRRLLHDLARRGAHRAVPLRGRQGAGLRRREGLLRPRRAGGGQDRSQALAQHRPARRGPDLDHHAQELHAFADAGVDELFIQQVGPQQDVFFETWAPAILGRFGD
jgi:hypothetical protein